MDHPPPAGSHARAAAAGLAGVVQNLAYHRNPEAPLRLERSVPSAAVTLMVNLAEDEFRTWDVEAGVAVPRRTGGAVFAGARSTPVVIDTAEQRHLVCVSFRWGGAAAFLGGPVAELGEDLVELDRLWGRAGALLREQLLEATDPLAVLDEALLAQLRRAPRPDPAVPVAVAGLQRGEAVAAVADRLGWTGKRLLRTFQDQVGLTPKRFARVQRLQRVLRALPRAGTVDWAEVAAGHGYCDQAHLIDEFRALAGVTPGAYLAAVGGEPNHVPLDVFANRPGQAAA